MSHISHTVTHSSGEEIKKFKSYSDAYKYARELAYISLPKMAFRLVSDNGVVQEFELVVRRIS